MELKLLSLRRLSQLRGRQFQFWSYFKHVGKLCVIHRNLCLLLMLLNVAWRSYGNGIKLLMRVILISSVLVSFSFINLNFLLIYLSALHPSIKLAYCKDKWDESYYDAGYSAFEHVVRVFFINEYVTTDFNKFDAYYKPPKKLKTLTSTLEVKGQG